MDETEYPHREIETLERDALDALIDERGPLHGFLRLKAFSV
jgi:hypothetical protein